MKINLKKIKGEEHLTFQEELSAEDLDLDVGVMHFPEPLSVKVEAWKQGHELTVQIHMEGTKAYTCSLCLEEFDNVFEKDLTLHYDIKGLDSVELDQDIRDEIISDHPIRILCQPDCKGLCSFCGANLNEESCDCRSNRSE